MLKVAEIIFQTCRTYLIQQGKFLVMLFIFIAVAMSFYFLALKGQGVPTLLLVLLFSVVGMAGSYSVAWYGIRINTYANARTAFASLAGQPWDVVNIPLRSLCPVISSGTASWDSLSVSRWPHRHSESPAVSSPRSPTSAPTS
jgi:K(+)-stimulated pyrophosphate-energized sodium pump